MNWFVEFPAENYFLCLLSQIRVKFPLIGPPTYISQVIVQFFGTSSDVSNNRKNDVSSANNFALVIKPSERSLI